MAQLLPKLCSRSSLFQSFISNQMELIAKCHGVASVYRKASRWNQAVSEAEKIVNFPTSLLYLRCLLSDEMTEVVMHIRKLVGTKHPLLKTARGLVYGDKHQVQIRGLIVLLMSKIALSSCPQPSPSESTAAISGSQRTLAEITEMIHTASLIHKGVLDTHSLLGDDSLTDIQFGNKISILSGDFLLANACTGLAQLNNTKVVKLISSAIAELMEAEFMSDDIETDTDALSYWLKKSYLSSGSLLAKSCQASLELIGQSSHLQKHAYDFGLYISWAHKLHTEIQMFTDDNVTLDENVFNLSPVQHFIHTEANGKCLRSSSTNEVVRMIRESQSLAECQRICNKYQKMAVNSLGVFAESPAKTALCSIVDTLNFDDISTDV